MASILIQVQPKPPKNKFSNYKRSFNLATYKSDTVLSKEFWRIKRRNCVPQIKWGVLRK